MLVSIGLVLHFSLGSLTGRTPRILISIGVMGMSLGAGLGLVSRLGWAHAGFRPDIKPRAARSLLLIALPVVSATIFLLAAGPAAGPSTFLLLGGLALLVALHEETWFRGVILTVLAPRGNLPAVVASAVLFGIAHSANLVTTPATPAAVAYQVLTASLVGIVFGAVRLRTGAIWPTILAHALVDWAAFVLLYPSIVPPQPKLPTAIAGVAAYGLLAGISLWMVRPGGGNRDT